MITAPRYIQKAGQQFLEDTPLILVSGVLAMLAGLTIVNTHNIWAWDWRVVVTIFGWAFLISGAIRLVAPMATIKIADSMLDRPMMTRISGAFWGVFGLFLTYKGYR